MTPRLKTYRARSAQEWRRWLEKHHDGSPGIWLLFYKRDSGKPSVTYAEALDEALCFGWIDSIVKQVDERCYVRKFTPRTDPKKWSALNLSHLRRLIAAGKVTESGLRALGVPLEPDDAPTSVAAQRRSETAPPDCMLTAIAQHPKAADFWRKLAPGYKKRYIGWVVAAKREDTRARRIDEVIGFLVEGKKSVLK